VAANFRAIGGPAAQGTTERWGKVYRTGVLSFLVQVDTQILQRTRHALLL